MGVLIELLTNGHRATEDTPAITLARSLTAETQAELARADGKASTLLAGSMVAVGILASVVATGQWSPLHMRPWPAALWWLAAAAAVVALGCLLAVIYPRTGPASRRVGRRHVLGYWGHAHAHRSVDELTTALRSRAARPELDRLADELAAKARIAATKFRLTRTAIWCLCAAFALAFASGAATWVVR